VNLAQHILIAAVRLYRWVLSPAKVFFFGPMAQCRFTPSCSAYALEALSRHGALSGSWLAARRVCRCHPWGGCGHDPVPDVKPEARPSPTTKSPDRMPGPELQTPVLAAARRGH
jgi:putative membrane protein insertion efficiency factor